jgi:cytidine deaminase
VLGACRLFSNKTYYKNTLMPVKKLTIAYEEYNTSAELSADEQVLVKSARTARPNAYAPYSDFLVGAAVQTKDGRTFVGSNQETANHKSSCAERVALDSAGAAGAKNQIAKIAVVGGPAALDPAASAGAEDEPVTSCGQCRQDFQEVEALTGTPLVIIFAGRNKIKRLVGVKNLLPLAFGPGERD